MAEDERVEWSYLYLNYILKKITLTTPNKTKVIIVKLSLNYIINLSVHGYCSHQLGQYNLK